MDSFISSSWSWCTQCKKSFTVKKFVKHIETAHKQTKETPESAHNRESNFEKPNTSLTDDMHDISSKVELMAVGNVVPEADFDVTIDELLGSDDEEENENLKRDGDHEQMTSFLKPEAVAEANVSKKRKIGPASKTGRARFRLLEEENVELENSDGKDVDMDSLSDNEIEESALPSDSSDSDDDIPENMPQSSDDDSDNSDDDYELPFKLPLRYDNDDDDAESDNDELQNSQIKISSTPVNNSEESDCDDGDEKPKEEYVKRRPGPASKTGKLFKNDKSLKKSTSSLDFKQSNQCPKTDASIKHADQAVQNKPPGESNDTSENEQKENNTLVKTLNEIKESLKELENGMEFGDISFLDEEEEELEDGEVSTKDTNNGSMENTTNRNNDEKDKMIITHMDDNDNDDWESSDDDSLDDGGFNDNDNDDQFLKNQTKDCDNPGLNNCTGEDNPLIEGGGTNSSGNPEAKNDLPQTEKALNNKDLSSGDDKGKDDENTGEEMVQNGANKESNIIQNENINIESETQTDNEIHKSKDQININKEKTKFRIPKNDLIIEKPPTLPTKSGRVVRKDNPVDSAPWRFWSNGQFFHNSNPMIYQQGQVFNQQNPYIGQDEIFNNQISYPGQDIFSNNQFSAQFFNNQIPHISSNSISDFGGLSIQMAGEQNQMMATEEQILGNLHNQPIGSSSQILSDPGSNQSEQIFNDHDYNLGHQIQQTSLSESIQTSNESSLQNQQDHIFNQQSPEDEPSKITENQPGPKAKKPKIAKSSKSSPNLPAKRSEPGNQWTLPEDLDESQIKLSNNLVEVCKTHCKVCNDIVNLVNMRGHTKSKHNMPISDYKSKFGIEYEIIEKVYHKCGICSTIVLLDSDRIAVHLKSSVHKAKDPNGTTHKQYNEQYMVMVKKEKK